jgi:hypothetical protein
VCLGVFARLHSDPPPTHSIQQRRRWSVPRLDQTTDSTQVTSANTECIVEAWFYADYSFRFRSVMAIGCLSNTQQRPTLQSFRLHAVGARKRMAVKSSARREPYVLRSIQQSGACIASQSEIDLFRSSSGNTSRGFARSCRSCNGPRGPARESHAHRIEGARNAALIVEGWLYGECMDAKDGLFICDA